MWWVERAEKDAERERNKSYREKFARRIVDRQLKDYCTALVSESIPCAETILNRAVQMRQFSGMRLADQNDVCVRA
jgi:hypothetical protein